MLCLVVFVQQLLNLLIILRLCFPHLGILTPKFFDFIPELDEALLAISVRFELLLLLSLHLRLKLLCFLLIDVLLKCEIGFVRLDSLFQLIINDGQSIYFILCFAQLALHALDLT